MSATGRISTPTPGIPNNCGYAPWERGLWSKSGRRSCRRLWLIRKVRFAVTSYWPEEVGPERLQELGRGHWSIENGQYYHRDRTQDEDRCPVHHTTAARNLSLFRSLAIFLFKQQSQGKDGKRTLPDFERHTHRTVAGG